MLTDGSIVRIEKVNETRYHGFINAGELAGKNINHGVITPPDRFRSELRLPLAGATAGVIG